MPFALDLQNIKQLDNIIVHSRPLKKGEYLFHNGDKFTALYALRSGCIKTFFVTDDGNEQITGFYLPGDIIGLSGINNKTYPISAATIETSTTCKIPYTKFEHLIEEVADLKNHLIYSMSKEIRENLQMMLLLSQKNAVARVASFIIDISSRIQRRGYAPNFIYLAMSRNEIANYLGLAVETISRVFSKLHKRGALIVNGRAVEIANHQLLAQIAGTKLVDHH